MHRFLIWGIEHYRSYWSQSRWFRVRKCSFPHDTCSAFALRNIRAFGVKKGCTMIFGRFARCSDFRMYGFSDHRIGWERGYVHWLAMESLEDIHHGIHELTTQGENRKGISTIIQSICLIQKYRLGRTPTNWHGVLRSHRLYSISPYVRGTNNYGRFLLYRSIQAILLRIFFLSIVFFWFPIFACVLGGFLCMLVVRRNVQQYRTLKSFDRTDGVGRK